MTSSSPSVTYSQFACIGAGFSGIGLAATLQRWYGIKDIRIFEKQANVGGTWHCNKYPGAGCDVPCPLYSYSFETNKSWSSMLPHQEELLRYLTNVAKKYDVPFHTSFNTLVEECKWIAETSRWRITARNLKTGEVILHESQFLFAASGQFVAPQEFQAPGQETFKGEIVHSSAWRDDINIKDKNVIVVGNGCTGVQLVPSAAAQAKHLTHIVRSKHWIVEGVEAGFATRAAQALKGLPASSWLLRLLSFLYAEQFYQNVRTTRSSIERRKGEAVKLSRYMKSQAPAKYHDILIPKFEVGCKRRVFDNGYLKSLHQENVELTNDKIVKVVPHGILTDDGTIHKADVIILATGFKTNHLFDRVNVIGRGGETINDHWEVFGGPQAYNTTSVNGFPNFFVLLGPNSLTGHTSAIMAAENGINYSLRVAKPVIDGQATTVEVNRDAEVEYSNWMQKELQQTVWNGCNNWYTRQNNKHGPWNGSLYPWSQAHFWYRSLFPVFSDFTYQGTVKPKTSWMPSNKSLITLLSSAAMIWLGMKGKNSQQLVLFMTGLVQKLISLRSNLRVRSA